jgi:hypothetical protein
MHHTLLLKDFEKGRLPLEKQRAALEAVSLHIDEWSGRVVSRLKGKNPAAPAVRREAEEEGN